MAYFYACMLSLLVENLMQLIYACTWFTAMLSGLFIENLMHRLLVENIMLPMFILCHIYVVLLPRVLYATPSIFYSKMVYMLYVITVYMKHCIYIPLLFIWQVYYSIFFCIYGRYIYVCSLLLYLLARPPHIYTYLIGLVLYFFPQL